METDRITGLILNSVININCTSYRMGTGATFTGDPAPGSRTTVQRRLITQTGRNWRFIGSVLPVQFLSFSGLVQNNLVQLNWTKITEKEIVHFEVERGMNNSWYAQTVIISDVVKLNEPQSFITTDNISGISNEIIYYRLKVIGKAGGSNTLCTGCKEITRQQRGNYTAKSCQKIWYNKNIC